MNTKQKETALTVSKNALNAYFTADSVVTDFNSIPVEMRLAFLQKTPAKFIKSREVNGVQVPYIDHFYAEKALNFISNFNWGSERITSEIKEIKRNTKNGVKTVYDAMVELKCWLVFPDGRRIERYVASGHAMYENPAVTRADALQSAISKAHTKFARQLGIGTNIQSKEESAYDRVSKHYIEAEPKDEAISNVVANIMEKVKNAPTLRELEKTMLVIKKAKDNNIINEGDFDTLTTLFLTKQKDFQDGATKTNG